MMPKKRPLPKSLPSTKTKTKSRPKTAAHEPPEAAPQTSINVVEVGLDRLLRVLEHFNGRTACDVSRPCCTFVLQCLLHDGG
jgi:hypothetical protein